MTKYFVPYTESIALRDLGFNEECFGYYPSSDRELLITDSVFYDNSELQNEGHTAPLFSQAFEFLLEKYSLYAVIIPTITMDWTFKTMTVVDGMVEVPPYKHVHSADYSTRKEAQLECLKQLIEIARKENDSKN